MPDEFVQAFRMGPVIDANGEHVRFGINFNESMFNYIYQNKLYSKAGQQQFIKGNPGVSFPRGVYVGDEVGVIMVKSAWKILGAGDDIDKFHHIPAWIYNPPQSLSCWLRFHAEYRDRKPILNDGCSCS